MRDEFPFNRYVSPDDLLSICFEGIYNVVVKVTESGVPLCFLHTASFNAQIAEMALRHVSETFPNDSVYVYMRRADELFQLNERIVTRKESTSIRSEPSFRMTL